MKIEPNINYSAAIITRILAVFIVLLLMKVCEPCPLNSVSWWWITLPIWLPVSLLIIWCILAGLVYWIASTEWVGTADPDDENF